MFKIITSRGLSRIFSVLFRRHVANLDTIRLALQHVAHIGYVSLFPLLLTLIPPGSPKLDMVLDIIEKDLMTAYGLRSLATSSSFYGQSNAPGDHPYWRGYIWMPINYLAVVALKHYEIHAEFEHTRIRCAELYAKLRGGLVSNVLKEYTRTGYLWEQYDDRTGEGTRGHPFSGWTALIVNILSESY
jgi:mannosyl-oligosaccharide glucosidase